MSTSLFARFAAGSAGAMRRLGAALDGMGKAIEVTKYTEQLVPSTRFVAVNGVAPRVSERAAFVAPSASVVGDVTLGDQSSVWYGAVVRGDVNQVVIGDATSIGDRAVVHVAKIQGDYDTSIGSNVTIGAGAMVHAATLGDAVVIGESAQVLDGAVVESNSMIAPAAVVTPGTKVPAGELWAGTPAKKVRALTFAEQAEIVVRAKETLALAVQHDYENSKSYQQIMEEAEALEIEEGMDDKMAARPPDRDPADVLGQGAPGRIFRSTLSHPEEAPLYQNYEKQRQQQADK